MAAFDYEAIDPDGRTRRGIISADSPRLARRALRDRQLLPVTIREARGEGRLAGLGRLFNLSLPARAVMGRGERTLFTRQLATLIGASVPVEEALRNMAQQADRAPVRQMLLDLRGRVMEGHRLAEALASWPSDFNQVYRAMVSAGEGSGSLGLVLARLADYLDRTQKLASRVQTALIYPSFVAVTALAVVMILMLFVVPQVVDQFDSMNRDLPGLTVAMIAISDALRVGWPLILLAGAGAAVGLVALRRRPAGRARLDQLLLSIPGLGGFVGRAQCARFTRTLGTLIASGVPALDAMAAARRTVTNTRIGAALDQAVAQVREGTSLSASLKPVPFLPPMVLTMATVGENTGRLDQMLDKAADYLDDSFEATTQTAVSLLEPVIIIAMGVVVALIVLSILLPILQLNNLAL